MRHGFADRVRFLECNLLEAVPTTRHLDVVVSNPPYISRRETGTLMREVRDHEPASALYGADAFLGVVNILTRGGGEGEAQSVVTRAQRQREGRAVRMECDGGEHVLGVRLPQKPRAGRREGQSGAVG